MLLLVHSNKPAPSKGVLLQAVEGRGIGPTVMMAPSKEGGAMKGGGGKGRDCVSVRLKIGSIYKTCNSFPVVTITTRN